MGPTRPVEVFFFKVFLAAQFANLLIYIECAPVLKPCDPDPHLVPLVLQTPHLFLGLNELIPALSVLNVDSLQVLLELRDLLAILSKQCLLVQVVPLDYRCDLLQIDPKFVAVGENL